MKHFKSPGVILGIIAVLLACTGVATGASRFVTGSQIKSSAITTKHIKNGSIKGDDLASGTIGPSKLSSSVQDKLDAAGTPGPVGPAGAQGPAGPAGPSAVNRITRVTNSGSIAAGDINAVSVACPPGQTSVSGGAITAGAGYVFSDDSFGGSGWSVGYDNYGVSVSADVTAVAYCAPSGQAAAPRTAHTALVDKAIAAQRATH